MRSPNFCPEIQWLEEISTTANNIAKSIESEEQKVKQWPLD